ncbi:MAG: glutamine ABC transporter permease [Beggiatoa sp. IS2]|nr:MAG: glutamine ABC transporter permease [Beggiatoa sp. IS2]
MLQTMLNILVNHIDEYLLGLFITFLVSVFALVGSLVLGTAVAILCVSPFSLIMIGGRTYVELIRNTPLLLQIFLFYYGLPALNIPISAFVAGTLGLTIYTSAFIAEAIRAGILAIPNGQTEAARATGLTYLQSFQYIILPQAFKIVIPAIGNQFINLVKNSAILSVIAGMDLMYHADLIATKTFHTFETYLLVALFYLLLTIPLSIGVNWLEHHLHPNSK